MDGTDNEGERIAKVLARAGVASRREAERLIEQGRVSVNAQTLTTPAFKVPPGADIRVDGEAVGAPQITRLFRYHKPPGLMTTHKDPQGRPTVFDNLPAGLPRVISVGRLDLSSEGLLLLTNDGELARRLELPATGWTRRYRVRAHGRVTQAQLDALQNGITVEGVRYGPIQAKLETGKTDRTGTANVWLTVALKEGKNREVRNVLRALGLQVNRLIRTSYGPFVLGALEEGDAQEVLQRQMRDLLGGLLTGEKAPARKPARKKAPEAASKEAGGAPAKAPAKPTGKTPGKAPGRTAGKAPGQTLGRTPGHTPGKTIGKPAPRRGGGGPRGAKP